MIYLSQLHGKDILNIELELEKISLNNDFDIIIKDNEKNVYVSSSDFLDDFGEMNKIKHKVKYSIFNKDSIMYSDDNIDIRRIQDKSTGLNFILLTSNLDCGYKLYMRASISPIKASVQISNKLLYTMAGLSILMSGIVISIIT